MSKIKAPALSLKDLLVQIKDLAEIQLDLAYSAVLYDDHEAAHQVLKLESKITEYLGYVIIRAIMAGRDLDLAEKMLALIRFASALEDISDAAADIAKLTIENISLGKFKEILMHAEEVTIRVPLTKKELNGKLVEDVERAIGMRIVAVRRGRKWILNPRGDLVLWFNDLLYLTGPEEKLDDAVFYLTGEKKSDVEEEAKIADHLKNFFDVLVSLKHTAETSLALSYYALLTGDKELANEVKHLEQWVDYMRDVLDVFTLKLSRHFDELDTLRGFFRIIDATEEITDGAYKLAQIVLSGIDVTQIFKIIFDRADEKILSLVVESDYWIAGKTVQQVDLEEQYGLFLLGIRRGKTWYFNPEDTMVIMPGDVLIIRGSLVAVNKFLDEIRSLQDKNMKV